MTHASPDFPGEPDIYGETLDPTPRGFPSRDHYLSEGVRERLIESQRFEVERLASHGYLSGGDPESADPDARYIRRVSQFWRVAEKLSQAERASPRPAPVELPPLPQHPPREAFPRICGQGPGVGFHCNRTGCTNDDSEALLRFLSESKLLTIAEKARLVPGKPQGKGFFNLLLAFCAIVGVAAGYAFFANGGLGAYFDGVVDGWALLNLVASAAVAWLVGCALALVVSLFRYLALPPTQDEPPAIDELAVLHNERRKKIADEYRVAEEARKAALDESSARNTAWGKANAVRDLRRELEIATSLDRALAAGNFERVGQAKWCDVCGGPTQSAAEYKFAGQFAVSIGVKCKGRLAIER